MIIVSACLAGIPCRYDGNSMTSENVTRLLREGKAIPVCPEQLGGLPTPRKSSEIIGNRVMTDDGEDFTYQFELGAKEALKLAILTGCNRAVLKSYSPSCGCGSIYDGSFSGKLIKGDGIFCKLLKDNNIMVIPDYNFDKYNYD